MTQNDINRAALALFAAREAGTGGSLEQMKAIAYCMRQRLKQGWHDGQWMTAIEHADEYAANLPGPRVYLDPSTRAFQRMVADVDDIYYGSRYDAGSRDQGQPKQPVAQNFATVSSDLEEALGKSCYWAFLGRPYTRWFTENILNRPADHPMRTQMGLMTFFE